ncbi:MAG: hypothetical protein QM710_15590 [Flavobacterium sp.]
MSIYASDKLIEISMQEQINPQNLYQHTFVGDSLKLPSAASFTAALERLDKLDPIQVKIWRNMTPAQRASIVFQAYRFALEAIRVSERHRHPNLSPEELAWRITRRMQRDQSLGKR